MSPGDMEIIEPVLIKPGGPTLGPFSCALSP